MSLCLQGQNFLRQEELIGLAKDKGVEVLVLGLD